MLEKVTALTLALATVAVVSSALAATHPDVPAVAISCAK